MFRHKFGFCTTIARAGWMISCQVRLTHNFSIATVDDARTATNIPSDMFRHGFYVCTTLVCAGLIMLKRSQTYLRICSGTTSAYSNHSSRRFDDKLSQTHLRICTGISSTCGASAMTSAGTSTDARNDDCGDVCSDVSCDVCKDVCIYFDFGVCRDVRRSIFSGVCQRLQ